MVKLAHKIEKGYEICVDLEGVTQEQYNEFFVICFNNVRESNELLQIRNNYANRIYILVCEEALKDAKKWLKNLAEAWGGSYCGASEKIIYRVYFDDYRATEKEWEQLYDTVIIGEEW